MSGERDYFDRYARGTGIQSSSSGVTTRQVSGNNSLGATSYQSSSYQSSSTSNGQGQAQTNFEAQRSENEGEVQALLKYASELNSGVIVSGSTDYSKISTLKNAILELKNGYFSQSSGFSVKGEQRDELDRRFLLIEH